MKPVFTYKGHQYSYKIINNKIEVWQLTVSDEELIEEGLKSGEFIGLEECDVSLIIDTVQEMNDVPYKKL